MNGTEAAEDQYPWFVLLEGGSCGGTLIANDRVLTSATCILNNAPETVRVGASNETDGVEAAVRCVNIHPDYHRTGISIAKTMICVKVFFMAGLRR